MEVTPSKTTDTRKTWYVYLLCDPDTQEPFYVGKGSGDRMYEHERLRKHDSNEKKKQIIRDIQSQGKEVLKKRIADFDDERDAYIYEWGMINVYAPQLTNIYPGYFAKTINRRKKGSQIDEIDIFSKLTLRDVAAYLRVSQSTIWKMVKKEGMPHVKFGGILRFDYEAVEAWLLEHEVSKRSSAVTH